MNVEPVTLVGEDVRLEPLTLRHAPDLRRHAECDLFRFFAGPQPLNDTPEEIRRYVAEATAQTSRVAFAVLLAGTGEAVGTTSFLEIRGHDRVLEIGATWYGRRHQGTRVNPACKLLLLQHAFDVLEANRVELKTDSRNLQSQRAIEKLGAVREGVLRRHRVLPDGYVRDTVVYSILPEEWPCVRDKLRTERLSR